MFVTTENSGPSASINAMNENICISCPDDGVSRGCVVVLRLPNKTLSAVSHEIQRAEVKCFHQEQSGDYTVAVFTQNTSNALQAKPLKVSVVSISTSTSAMRKSTM